MTSSLAPLVNFLGCDPRRVEIAPHSDRWGDCFLLLASVTAVRCCTLHHIGSTAVRGLPAKPVIDGLMLYTAAGDLEQIAAHLKGLGFVRGSVISAFTPEDVFSLRDESGREICRIHAMLAGNPAATAMLRFRDALRNSTELAWSYFMLKRALAAAHPDSREDYCRGKAEFVTKVLNRS